MAKASQAISEQLRAAILSASESRYQISVQTGVAASVLSRFVNRKQGIDLATADKLAAYLGLELRPKAKRKAR
jgi:hypothetical protein